MSAHVHSVLGVLGMLGLLSELLRAVLALALVSGVAVLALRFLSRRAWFSAPVVEAGPTLRVLRRVTLEPRKHLYLVEVGQRVLLLGAGDGAASSLLLELGPGEPPASPGPAPTAPTPSTAEPRHD